MMMQSRKWLGLILLSGLVLSATTGCGCRYMTNRYYDFRDMGAVSVGVSAENSATGIVPPALGLYFEATDFLHLGAIKHVGYTAEMDLRGTGVYWEDRTRLGLLFWQALNINQDIRDANYKNYFKTPGTKWAQWMRSPLMCWGDSPAKDLTYCHWKEDLQYGCFLRHRGYQYWEYVGVEAAICEPFLTHFGLNLRLGFDVSETSDFLLGWFGIDYKHDDLTRAMFAEKLRMQGCKTGPCEKAKCSAPIPAPDTTQMDQLRAENERLAKELAECKGQLSELNGGLEIVLPEHVLFDTGKAVLKESGKTLLDQVAGKIRSEYPDHEITIEGHTDDRPIKYSKWKSNWELGAGRALAVLHYMIDKAGLPKSNFAATTHADNIPVASNETKDGRQENRRAVVVLRAKKKAVAIPAATKP